MNKLEHTISLILGDSSGDGHDKTLTIIILSNLDKKALLKAYNNGSKKVGFDLSNEVCDMYEDRLFPKDKLNLLVKNGFTINDFGKQTSYEQKECKTAMDNDASEGLNLWVDQYCNIFLFITKLGNKEFEYKILEGATNPTIDIGGYGLFE